MSASAQASFSEEPGAGKPHAGICEGAPGQPGVLPRHDPETGRWASRDPIEEEGGHNIYAFTSNDSMNAWDVLGRKVDLCLHGPGVCNNPRSNPNRNDDTQDNCIFTVMGHGTRDGKILDQRDAPAEKKDRELQTPGENNVKALTPRDLAKIIDNHPAYHADECCEVDIMLYICHTGSGGKGSVANKIHKELNQPVAGANGILYVKNGTEMDIEPLRGANGVFVILGR